ncbi:ubiquinone anaerobic biosynthesis accessory factor UbiT [Brevundimonas sp.]|uniref:ubiquinone anaerobic biosynthesis accessory factor UbiT n=1 Tax=Brevundimonas sp. TaxID=1871086 RepID=UPI002FC83B1F
MQGNGPGAWRGRGGGRAEIASGALMMMRRPVETILSRALRRIALNRPDVFERLGPWREADVVVAPSDFPVCFRLRPDGSRGTVRVIRHDDPAPAAARISGPLATLLELFDGEGDADAAFFSRRIRIEGDTAAIVALHNTLEAAGLTFADILGVGPGLRGPVNQGLARLRDHLGSR